MPATHHSRAGRIVRWSISAVVLVGVVVVLWNQGQQFISGDSAGWGSYLLIALLVFGDAVCPVLPGETTLNAGAVLAQNGTLNIWLVIVCGAVGAVVGDSCVYWIARKAKGRVRAWMTKASESKSAAKMLTMLRDRGPVFLLFGRYVPGVRFALNASLGGVVHMPYQKFLAWSAVSGTLWSALTCASAYFISAALAGYPVLSLIVTGAVSTGLITVVIWVQKRWPHHEDDDQAQVLIPPR